MSSQGNYTTTHLAEHADRFSHEAAQKRLPFRTGLMDTGYATRPPMRQIEALDKLYSCPLEGNRKTDDSEGQQRHRTLETLQWSEAEKTHGEVVHRKDVPTRSLGLMVHRWRVHRGDQQCCH